ncbi:hypothetical protein SLS58_000991 [Diplodia intermedia]|uniref:Uncharacterized protein n=1 Tax=Diplodia intermedia TaxID=856260 RepID=A0ABR3U459_9PEZI
MHSICNALVGTQHLLHTAATNTRDRIAGAAGAVEWHRLPKQTIDHVAQHPYQTAFYAINGVAFAAPLAFAAPVLGAVGFGAVGPTAGSMAAGAQGASVAAGSLFATLQSAAMGGSYGAAAVGGAVQAGAAVGTAAVGAWNYFRGGGGAGAGGDGGNDGGDDDDDGEQSRPHRRVEGVCKAKL